MVRIEEQSAPEKEALKEELKKEIRPKIIKKRSFFSCGGCLLILAGFILAISFLGGAVIAKTGLIRLPFFTDWFYEKPAPARLVAPSGNTETIEETLKKKLEEIIFKEAKNARAGKISFDFILSEEELSALLVNFLKQNAVNLEEIEGGQVSVEEEEVIFYISLRPSSGLESALVLGVVPAVYNQKINIRVRRLAIGTLPLPAEIGNLLFQSLWSVYLSSASNLLSEFGEIKDIKMEEGKLIFNAEVSLKEIK